MKHALRVLSILLLPCAALGQFFPYSGQSIINSNGAKIGAFSNITVCTYGASGTPCSPKATIYYDTNGTAKPNPFNADQNGNFNFFAATGIYVLNIQFGPSVYAYPVNISASGQSVLCTLGTGIDAGASIQNCINVLPASGGVVDASLITGAQTAAASIVANKPVTLKLGSITLACSQPGGAPCITVSSNGVRISGVGSASVLQQANVGTTGSPRNIISNTSGTTTAITDFEADNLKLVGVPGTNYAGGNNGVDIIQGTRVSAHDLKCTGLQLECVKVQNSVDVAIRSNEGYSLSGGIRLIGVRHFRIHHNNFHDTQNAATILSIPYAVDSVSGTGFPPSVDGVIDGNVATNYPNTEAVLIHDGSNLTITANVGNNVSTLVSLIPFAAPDAVMNWVVVGNTMNGTLTASSQPSGYGIACNGQSGLVASHGSISGNTVNNANRAILYDTQSGIGVNFCDDVEVVGNTVHGAGGHGIELAAGVTRVNIHGNMVTDVVASTGTYRDCIAVLPNVSGLSGRVDGNYCDSAGVNVRLDSYVPSLIIGPNNVFTNVTNSITDAFNAKVDSVLPIPVRLSIGAGLQPVYPLDIQKQYNSGLLTAGTPAGTTNNAGSLSAGSYRVQWTYVNILGQETTPGPEAIFVVPPSGNISLNAPVSQPGMAQSYHIYATAAGGATGTEKQCDSGNGIDFSTGYNIATACAGALAPGVNGTIGPELQLKVNGIEAPYTTDSTVGYGAQIQNQIATGNTQNTTSVKGGATIEHDHFGTGTMTKQEGVTAVAANRSTGTISTGNGLDSTMVNLAAGTITEGHGVVSQLVNNGGGTFTTGMTYYALPPAAPQPIGTYYAFRADDPGANCTTCWQFYSTGTKPSFLGGPLQLGPRTISTLPAAGSNVGMITVVSDSTVIAAEGQNCASGGTTIALAFSSGAQWKCF